MTTMQRHVYGHRSHLEGAPTFQAPGAWFVTTDPRVVVPLSGEWAMAA
jgi:hypothetical protein